MIKAAFFDLDETLVDSTQASREANSAAFKDFGYDYEKIKEKTRHISSMGRTIPEALRVRLDGANITERQIPFLKLLERRRKYFFEFAKKYTYLYKGAESLIKNLKNKKIIIAVVSSSTKAYIDFCLDKFRLKPYIDFIFSADDIIKGKPNPECYEKAYKYLKTNYGNKVEKKECLVIEDTENGIISAHNAGLKTVLIPSKYSVIPKTIKPDYQFKSLKDFDFRILD